MGLLGERHRSKSIHEVISPTLLNKKKNRACGSFFCAFDILYTMKNLAYYNGAIGEAENMVVPFCDRVCFFGDGVYDATYARNRKIFSLDEHLHRLYESAFRVQIEPPMDKNDLSRLLRSLVTRCDEAEHLLYVQFTRGISIPRNHVFAGGKSNLWITVTPKAITPREKRLSLLSYPDKRYGLCSVKTLNLLPNVLASNRAAEKGCDEAVFTENGVVHECAHSNIHLLRNGTLLSAPPGEKVLGGIARKHLLHACIRNGIPVEERFFTVEELLGADEVYVTSAGTLLSPCAFFDGTPVGGQDRHTTDLLQNELYRAFYACTD